MDFTLVWYVSQDVLPWEVAVLRSIARGLLEKGHVLSIFGWNADCWEGFPFTLRKGLGGLDKGIKAFFPGSLWHVWGKMPSFAWLLGRRTYLLHTSWRKEKTCGRSIPVFFEDQCGNPKGFRIFPTFDKKWFWELPKTSSLQDPPSQNSLSVCIPSCRPAYPASLAAITSFDSSIRWICPGFLPSEKGKELPLSKEIFVYWREYGGILVFTNPLSVSDLWLGGIASMLAVPVVAPQNPLYDDFFGPEGYVPVRGPLESQESWVRAIERANSKDGRNRAAQSRMRLERLYPEQDAVESLLSVYHNILD